MHLAFSSKAARLRQMLSQPKAILAPGVYDALTAKLAAQAGFDVVYMTGYGVSASMIAAPDVGLLTATEMVTRARQIALASDLPVIADADTGYGNPLNVGRTVVEYEAAGVAALHIEDQTLPKKCGHMEGKTLITRDAMVQKIKAAIDARRDPDFLIIARTDARTVLGLDEAIIRARSYAVAGADAVFVESPMSADEMRRIADELAPTTLVLNMATGSTVDGGKTPPVAFDQAERWGYKIILYPVHALYAAAHAVRDIYGELNRTRSIPVSSSQLGFNEFNALMGLPDLLTQSQKYAVDQHSAEALQ
jgi:2-methylisocitrate lyase-like PEP mutase family enzyme